MPEQVLLIGYMTLFWIYLSNRHLPDAHDIGLLPLLREALSLYGETRALSQENFIMLYTIPFKVAVTDT